MNMYSADGETRTLTGGVLSAVPLPLGYVGDEGRLPRDREESRKWQRFRDFGQRRRGLGAFFDRM